MSDSLLSAAKDLAKLTDEQATAVILAIDRSNSREHSYAFSREHSYALTAMLCGTICFLGVVAAFVYLVVQGHARYASVLLGTAVLRVIGQIIHSRLRRF